jgi:PA14 domain
MRTNISPIVHPAGMRWRSGNALIAAMGMVVVIAGVVLVSSTSATQGLKTQGLQRRQTKALAALEAVLTRRETMVATMAINGNPNWPTLIDWTGSNPPNYGIDVVGDCLVRWRIEPGRTVKDLDVSTTSSTGLKYILNPPPDGVSANSDPNAVQNGFSYLYRVAAEAEFPGRNTAESPSLAQGARYVSVSAQPTFRWVIDYTRNGPLGDLELSHDPAVTIRGNINSNGAIYFGSNLQVNDWTALAGGSGATLVGPDVTNAPVVVSGYDGVYRLSKPNNYGYLNKFPMANGATASDPTTLMTTGTGPGGAPLFADIPNLDYSSWLTATLNGRFISPYRINNAARLITSGSIVRQINGNSLIGSVAGGTGDNDSRDLERTPQKFAAQVVQAPPTGFNNYVRTAQTSARREVLSKEFSNRALEPQVLIYREVDGDPLTDDHDFAVPQFFSPSADGSVTTTVDPIAAAAAVNTVSGSLANGNLLVEAPGNYVTKALGTGRAMTRLADGSGWVITDQKGVQLSTATANGQPAGLIIRERPVPWTDAWPGTTDPTRYVPFSDPQALPYALGKHWRPVVMPFTPIDVTDNLYMGGNDNAWASIGPFNTTAPSGGWDRSATYPQRAVSYMYAGNLLMIGANAAPVYMSNNGTNTQAKNNFGTAITAQVSATLSPTPVSNYAYTPGTQYHTATWRMLHLKNRYGLTDAQILNQPQGLAYSFWNDDARLASNATACGRPDQVFNFPFNANANPLDATCQPLLGPPVWPQGATTAARLTAIASAVTTTLNYNSNANPWLPGAVPSTAITGDTSNYYSVRWEGFLIPPATGSFVFQTWYDDCIRIWIDDRLLYEGWSYPGGSPITTNPVTMVSGHPAKIVIDYRQLNGGHGMYLKWSGPSLASGFSDIPASAMRVPPAIGGFDKSKFSSITVRIKTDSVATIPSGVSLANPKIGLMLRPDRGEPNLVNGRDAYLALCWSPKRGVFMERRMDPARLYNRISLASSQWIGAGSYTVSGPSSSSGSSDASGNIPTPIGYSGSYTVGGITNTYGVTRTATMTCGPIPAPVAGSVTSTTTNSWSSTTTASPASAAVNLGDGSTVNVTYGPYQVSYTQNSSISKSVTMSRTYTFTIAGGVYPAALLNLSYPITKGQPINLYNPTSTSTTTAVSATLAYQGYTVTNPTTITVPQSSKVTVNGVAVTGTPQVIGSTGSNNIWQPSGGWPSGFTGATLVARLNAISWQGRNDWVLGNGTGSISAPATFAVLNPVAPADPSPASLTTLYDRLPHSFSMSVTPGYTMYVDTNPFVSRLGTWSPTPVTENRPWVPNWSSASAYGIVQALTNSFRPDLANSAVLGSGSPLLLETSPAIASAAPTPAVTSVTPSPVPWADDITSMSALNVLNNSVWLRINRDSSDNVTFQYNTGASPLANGQSMPTGTWTTLSTAEPISISAPQWQSLLAGPAIQSGDVNTALQVSMDNLSVATTENIGNNDGVWDWKDWDGASSFAGIGSPLSRYYASQYQVFYGIYDITEDFFTWGDQTGNDPVATEDWFYNPREFWSQGDSFQYWDSQSAFTNKEPWGVTAVPRPNDEHPINYNSRWSPATGWVNAYTGSSSPGAYTTVANPYGSLSSTATYPTTLLKDLTTTTPWGDLTNRQNMSKVTVLTLNLKSLWLYLNARDVMQAKTANLLSGGATVPGYVGPSLASTFNGLIYAARTNRYPFNPNQPLTDPIDPPFDPANGITLDPTRIGGVNPWSYRVRTTQSGSDPWEFLNSITPNFAIPKLATPNYIPLTVSGSTPNWTPSGPVQFQVNGSLVQRTGSMVLRGIHKLQPYSQIPVFPCRPQHFIQGVMLKNGANINWGLSATPNFGTGGTSIVTPNALYVQGDFNTTTNLVMVSGVPTLKITPVAIMGDSINLLSNSFNISTFQQRGLVVGANGSISGSGILANPNLATASTTTYNAGIITHNQPTTQARVLEGQGAAFIDTMLFLENWSGSTMNFTGSLVVMDTRRYTDAFLLDGIKTSGRSPLGYLGWAATIESARSGPGLPAASTWPGSIPKVYTAPARNLNYQFDFRTAPGTPPFVPNGMSTVGVGGWTRLLQ